MLYYENACPNCNGRISYERLVKLLPCEKCLPDNFLNELEKIKPGTFRFYKKVASLLRKNYSLKNYNRLVKLLKTTNNFLRFFKKAIGSNPWNAQRMWAVRVFKNMSFAIMAPTGTGKTTFLIVLSIYLAQKFKKKVYFVLPTSLLAAHVKERFDRILSSLNLQLNVVAYHSLLRKKEKEEALQKILNRDFQILITTNMFLSKKFDIIKGFLFDTIIVDDVDSFLKASKNVDKVLNLLGFNEEIIQRALENVDLRRNLIFITDKNKRKEVEKKIEENERLIKRAAPINRILIVSGASTRARAKRVLLFKELLNFQIGTRIEGIRNVEDVFEIVKENIEEKVYGYVSKFGKGGLIFVPMDKGMEYAKYLEEYLISKGIRAKALEKTKLSIINDFVAGNLDVLIGVASYRSPLARGIDLPEVIRYAIFCGVPKFKIKIDLSEFKPGKLIMLLLHIREYLDKKEDKDKVDVIVNKLRKITGLTEQNFQLVIEAIKQNSQLEGFLEYCRQTLKDAYDFIKSLLENKEFLDKLKQSKKLTFGKEEEFFFVVADVQAYIQASGRTSRLYAGGISKGLSLVLVDEEKAFNSLREKIKWFDEKAEFKEIKEVNLQKIFDEIDKDRALIRAIKEGKIEPKRLKSLVKIGLMIVESPTKAKTIARFFGTPAIRDIENVRVYEVSSGDYILLITASIGHVFDLVTKDGYHGVLVKEGKFLPIYGTIKTCPKCNSQYTDNIVICPKDNEKLLDKITVLRVLRDLSIEVDEVLIATDPDAEGEKIGFDIANFIRPFNKNIKRLEFHEITYRAIRNALNNPREININLVKAQIVRRIEDRWFGFELSQKVQKVFDKKSLSAGRVQTPVLGWIIQRTLESKNSVKDYLRLRIDGITTIFEMEKMKVAEKEKLFEELLRNPKVLVKIVEKKEEVLNPLPPYTTDTLLKDASNVLKFDSAKTMKLAQDLFESGLCLAPGSLVLLNDGRIKRIEEVQTNEKLLGSNDLHEKESTILKFWKIPYRGLLKEIVFENGYSIKATPDHAIFVFRDGKFGWVSAKHLTTNDYVAIPFNVKIARREKFDLLDLLLELKILDVLLVFDNNSKVFERLKEKIKGLKVSTKYKYLKNRAIPLKYIVEWGENLKEIKKEVKWIYRQRAFTQKIPIFELNENFWYFVGLVMGDGSVRGSKIAIAQKNVKNIEKIVKKIFPFLKFWRSGFQIWTSCSLIAEILRRLDVRGKLNGLVFSFPENWINAMIAGFIDTDGCVSLMYDNGKPNLRVMITSKEKERLEKIGFYLFTIGILNYIHEDRRTKVYSLIISNKSLERFVKKIGKYMKIKKEKLKNMVKTYLRFHEHYESDILPFSPLFQMLNFEFGEKNKILKKFKIDVWNWDKGIPREKLRKVLKFAKNTPIKSLLEFLVNSNITWIKIKEIRDVYYEGYVYDFTTTTSNFFANLVLNHNCTYHRTDSTSVSSVGINIAKEYITENFGEEFFVPRSWTKEGAHECIRPTKPIDSERLLELLRLKILQIPIRITKDHLALYDLIFRRFIASQMKSSKVEKTNVKIILLSLNLEKEEEFITKIIEEGFVKITKIKEIKIEEKEYEIKEFNREKDFFRKPSIPLFTQGDVISLMKERGIGRPSTYATIISKLLDRRYVISVKNKLIATKRGMNVYEYLKSKFEKYISEELTRELERKMDLIEESKIDYIDVLEEIYEESIAIRNSE